MKNYSQGPRKDCLHGRLWKRKIRRFRRENSDRIESEYQWELLWDGLSPSTESMTALATAEDLSQRAFDPLCSEDVACATLRDPMTALIATLDSHGLVPRSCFANPLDRGVITNPAPLLPILMKHAAMQLKLQGVGPTEDCLIQGNVEVEL
jgi:hypothetical protein